MFLFKIKKKFDDKMLGRDTLDLKNTLFQNFQNSVLEKKYFRNVPKTANF